jgi:oxygen-dependent protoporphyrinogen oxidase
MMGISRPPDEALVTRWPEAFPQYSVGHLSRVASIEAAAASLPSVALAGAALHGVGIPACIASGRRAARAVQAAR